MADEKTVKLLISMGLDKASAKYVKDGIMSVDFAIKQLATDTQASAKDLNRAFEIVAKSGKYSVSQLDHAALELNASLKLLQKSGGYAIDPLIEDADKGTQKLAGLKDTLMTLGAGMALYQTGDWAKSFITDSYNAAASAERLGNATDNLGKRFGVAGKQIADSIQEASGGTISEMDAMKAANQAMLLGVVENEKQFKELANMAVVLGRAMGQDAGKSIEDISIGIGRQSRLILDNLGIIIDTDKAYSDYAVSIGKVSEQLTDAEKKTAFTNAVMEQGAKKAAELGGVMDDTASKTERLTASWSDFQVEFGKLLGDAGALDALNGVIQKLIDGAEAWQFVFTEANKLSGAAAKVNEDKPLSGVNRGLEKATLFSMFPTLGTIGELTGATDYLLDLKDGFIGAAAGSEELAKAYGELSTAQNKATGGAASSGFGIAGGEIDPEAEKAYKAAIEKRNADYAELETDNRRKLAQIDTEYTRDTLAAELDFENKRLDIAEDGALKREEIARNNARSIADIYTKYQQDVAAAAKDLSREQKQIAIDYGREQAKIDTDGARKRVDIETDFRRQLRDIRSQFSQEAEEAVRNQDAIAFLAAQRSRDEEIAAAQQSRDDALADAETDRQREKEDAATNRQTELEDAKLANQQKLEDLQISLQQQLDAQSTKNAQALEDQQLAEAQALDSQTKAEERKRAEMQTKYQQGLEDAKIYYNQKLADLRASLEKELSLIAEYDAKKLQKSSTGVSSAGGTNYTGWTAPGRATGGYVGHGLYEMGEMGNEFVLNATTTRALESGMGSLSQSSILQLLGQARGNVNYAPNYTFNDRDDSRVIVDTISRQVDEKLLRYTRGY